MTTTPSDSPTPDYTPTADERTYRVTGKLVAGDWPLFVLMVADIIFAVWVAGQVGDKPVPVHWGVDGQADKFGPAWMNIWLPVGLGIGLYLMMLFVPLIDPRRTNYALFEGTLRALRWAFVLFAIALQVPLALICLDYDVDVVFVIRLAVPMLFLIIGNNLARVRPTYFVGIRVPWTLASESVWVRTHRLAGRLFVGGSLLAIAAAFIPDPTVGFVVFFVLVMGMSLVPIVYSAVIYRQDAHKSDNKPIS